MLGIIDDGLTLSRFIKATEFHGNVRIKFRPVPTTDHDEVAERVAQLAERGKRREADDLVYQTIARRMIEWEFLTDEGQVIREYCGPAGKPHRIPNPTADVIARSVRQLQNRLVTIVYMMNDPGDPDPFKLNDKPISASAARDDAEKN